jgi:hypothetical protein
VAITQLSAHSSCLVMVSEHLFAGEVMRYCWSAGMQRDETLKSQADNSGDDIVLEAHAVMRHARLTSGIPQAPARHERGANKTAPDLTGRSARGDSDDRGDN